MEKQWKCFWFEVEKLEKDRRGSLAFTIGHMKDTYQDPTHLIGISVAIIAWVVGVGLCWGDKKK